MKRYILIFLFIQSNAIFCVCEISASEKEKILNGFTNFLNSLPNNRFIYSDGVIERAEEFTHNKYDIRVKYKSNEEFDQNHSYILCYGHVFINEANEVVVGNHLCESESVATSTPSYQFDDTIANTKKSQDNQQTGDVEKEGFSIEHDTNKDLNVPKTGSNIEQHVQIEQNTPVYDPVVLNNEIQTDTTTAAGEQFIAAPSDQPPCIGCSSQVNPQAAGVNELAQLGVKQLDTLENDVRHTLNTVLSVERQVQVVNGVRYILTMLVDYNSCPSDSNESCVNTNVCKVSVLEKPWVKLPDGSKLRTIVANNCTKQWLFNDNQDFQQPSPDNHNNNPESIEGIVKVIHNTDSQSKPEVERTLTDEEIKTIEQQIIPNNYSDSPRNMTNDFNSQNVETVKQYQPVQSEYRLDSNSISEDKKKAIDDFLSLFETTYTETKHHNTEETATETNRSFPNNLNSFDEKSREKRELLLGGKTVQDPKNPHYQDLAKQSLQKYVMTTGTTQQHTLVSVDKVTTQVVSGVKTNIQFTASSASGDTVVCVSDIWERPWLGSTEIDVNCEIQNLKGREKRQIPGGVSEADPKSPRFRELAQQSLQKYVMTTGATQQHTLVSVDKVTTQVVAGELIKIKFTASSVNGDKVVCSSTIWEQPWLNKTDIDVTCEVQNQQGRRKRQITGGINEQDPKKPRYRELAQQSLQEYVKTTGTTEQHTLVSVDKVTTQVVSGVKTNIQFTASSTNGDKVVCSSTIWEQPWLNKTDIDVTCEVQNQQGREKRQADGGINEEDPKNPRFRELAQQSLQKYVMTTGTTQQHTLVSVDKVTTQVVSGVKTNIQFTASSASGDTVVCVSEIWERSWLGSTEIDVNCEIQNLKGREKRQIPGGVNEADPKNPRFRELAQHSLQEYIKSTGTTKQHTLVSVDKVTTQVVSGLKTYIEFTASSACGDMVLCVSEIWERPWLGSPEIKVNCEIQNQKSREKRQIPGGINEKDPKNPRFRELAQQSLQKYVMTTGTTQQHTLVSVDKVTTQVVSGVKTNIQFTASSASGDTVVCVSEIWERPWLRSTEIDVNCEIQNLKGREKRQIPGGVNEADPKNPRFRELAQQSLQKYVMTTGTTQQHTLVSVDKVTTQVVAGELIKIKFTASSVNGDKVVCSSTIWEQPWLNKTDIDVTCEVHNQQNREKRSISIISKQYPKTPRYRELAQRSLQEYVKTTGTTEQHTLVSVDEVTTEVVPVNPGIVFNITNIQFTASSANGDKVVCSSKIFEKIWLNKNMFHVTCEVQNQQGREKRQADGGINEEDPKNPRFQELAQQSLQKYVMTTGTTQQHTLVSVDKVTKQLVAGELIKIKFTASSANGDKVVCSSTIWEQPWLNKTDIDVTCEVQNQQGRQKRHITGGINEQDPKNPRYRELAQQSLQKYVMTTGTTQQHTLVSVDKVTTQVVSGIKTNIQFTASSASGGTVVCVSEIWERSWLGSTEIDVNCEIQNLKGREKRQIPGGVNEADPKNPRFRELAQQSLQEYIKSTGTTKQHTLVSVDKVTTQVVSGLKTYIEFTASSACGDMVLCVSEIWERPWLGSPEIKVNCEIQNQKSREKRQIPGGINEADPKNPRFRELAQQSLQKYVMTTGTTQQHTLVSVDKVTTQVVAGELIKIKFTASSVNGDKVVCSSTIWEQPWLNKTDIDVTCEVHNQQNREKRSIPIISKQYPKTPRYRELVQQSLQEYVKTTGTTEQHTLVSVDEVTTQVVPGLITNIQFTASSANGDKVVCSSKIWEKLWLNKNMFHVTCEVQNQQGREKRQADGGINEEDPKNPRFQELAQQSLQKYVMTTGTTQQHTLVSVDKVTTQLVAGELIKIKFTASSANGDKVVCSSTIWEQPWLNKTDIDVTCEVQCECERQITGGIKEQDPKNPRNRELAQQSLQEYVKTTGTTKQHTLLSVDKVTTQVVSGVMTNIQFTASSANGDKVVCSSKIWEQLWLNKTDINVTCEVQNQNKEIRDLVGGASKQNVIKKRSIPEKFGQNDVISGGRVNRDPNTPEYLDLAEHYLRHYLKYSNTIQHYKVVKVENVTTQIVSGRLTRLQFLVSPTDCNVNDDGSPSASVCNVVDISDVKRCSAEVLEKPWQRTNYVNINCQIDQSHRNRREIRKKYSNRKPDTHVHFHDHHFVGGFKENDPSKEEYRYYADKSLRKYVRENNLKSRYKVLEVEKVQSKVVAGIIYKISYTAVPTGCSANVESESSCRQLDDGDKLFCHTVISGLGAKKIDVSCQKNDDAKETGKRFRSKRQLLGGIQDQNVNKTYYRDLAKKAVQEYERVSKTKYFHKVMSIEKVTQQVVAGFIISMDFLISPTTCLLAESVPDPKNCPLQKPKTTLKCFAEINDLLDDDVDITVKCKKQVSEKEKRVEIKRKRRQIRPEKNEVNDDMADHLAKEALKHIEAKYPHPRKQKIVRIFSFDKLNIAGEHYIIKLEVGFTDCLALTAQENCSLVQDGGLNRFCRVNVWLQPLTHHLPKYRVSCDNETTNSWNMYRQIQAEKLFYNFMATYNPYYLNDHTEMTRRFDIFKENLLKIHELNKREQGTATYGITRYADLTYEEFSNRHLGLKPSPRNANQIPRQFAEIPKVDIPEQFDWRDHGAVTEVKNQGSCGSCWAFSVTGNVEGQWKLKRGELVSLSEQELVDCDKKDSGCNGGDMDVAYRAIEELGGLETEDQYPYEGEQEKCSFNKSLSRVQITGAVNISSDEVEMAKWLTQNGPISIGINANAMQFYMGGISHPWKMLCSPKNLDHGVLIVGYGIKNYPLFNKRIPYWVVKNSWGTSWGEQGYYRVYRGDGTCGVNMMASSAVV